VEATKNLALELSVPIVLLSVVDGEAMRASRLRIFHLRGSSAIAFESDVDLMMNGKRKAVSRIHLAYDPVRARGYKDWVVMSVEKNRGGEPARSAVPEGLRALPVRPERRHGHRAAPSGRLDEENS
jgi:replicative DNA helicase